MTVTGDDIAEEIVWCASRPDHVQIAQMRKFADFSHDGELKLRSVQSSSPLHRQLLELATESLNEVLKRWGWAPSVLLGIWSCH